MESSTFWAEADCRRDPRQIRSHRLQERVREGFAPRGEYVNVERGEDAGYVRLEAQEMDTGPDPQAVGERREFSLLWAGPGDDQIGPGIVPRDRSERPDQDIEPLVGSQLS